MRVVTDQMDRRVELPEPPRRIVSLVPSQTELLFDLGLAESIVGVTKFCVHPADGVAAKPRVGGTKQVYLDRVEALRPDLIIGNKEENERATIERLAQSYPVWMSDVRTVDDSLAMIRGLGLAVGRLEQAQMLSRRVARAVDGLAQGRGQRVAYLIWWEPMMAVGCDTYIDSMLTRCGWRNAFAERSRYPEIDLQDLRKAAPQRVMLSSEPFPFRPKHAEQLRSILGPVDVRLVDGETYSWYGTRILNNGAAGQG